jgi:predicted lipoprotein with Yx(FWY)xxD motif
MWTAFVARIGAEVKGELTVHTRADGQMQWGWNGRPLYTFAGDQAPGDAEGDGLGGVWHAVRPGVGPSRPAPLPMHAGAAPG